MNTSKIVKTSKGQTIKADDYYKVIEDEFGIPVSELKEEESKDGAAQVIRRYLFGEDVIDAKEFGFMDLESSKKEAEIRAKKIAKAKAEEIEKMLAEDEDEDDNLWPESTVDMGA